MLSTQSPPLSSRFSVFVNIVLSCSSHSWVPAVRRREHVQAICALAVLISSVSSASVSVPGFSLPAVVCFEVNLSTCVMIVVYTLVRQPPYLFPVPFPVSCYYLYMHYPSIITPVYSSWSLRACLPPPPLAPVPESPHHRARHAKDGVQPSAAPSSVRRLPYYLPTLLEFSVSCSHPFASYRSALTFTYLMRVPNMSP